MREKKNERESHSTNRIPGISCIVTRFKGFLHLLVVVVAVDLLAVPVPFASLHSLAKLANQRFGVGHIGATSHSIAALVGLPSGLVLFVPPFQIHFPSLDPEPPTVEFLSVELDSLGDGLG